MNLQEQIDTIQALMDGRRVTRTTIKSGNAYRVPTGHFFDFVHNTYTIEPLYKEGEVIMVQHSNGKWWPRPFIGMDDEGATCANPLGGCSTFANHRKQNPTDKGEA